MRLQDACDQLNAMSCGKPVGCSVEQEGDDLIAYVDFANGPTLTCTLPASIREQNAETRRVTVQGSLNWLIHEGLN